VFCVSVKVKLFCFFIVKVNLTVPLLCHGGRRGVVVTRLIRSAKLLYAGPG